MSEPSSFLESRKWIDNYTSGVVQKVQSINLSKSYQYPKFTCKDFNGEVDIILHKKELENIIHLQDYLEIIYARKGCAYLVLENSKIPIPQKSFMLIGTTLPHTDSADDGSEVYHILVNTSTIIKTFFNLLYEAPRLIAFFTTVLLDPNGAHYLLYQMTPEAEQSVEICFEDILRVFSKKESQYIPILKCQLALLLLNISAHYEKAVPSTELCPLSVKIMEYIYANYTKISLNDVANHFNYNSDYISRLLKRDYGASFKQILTKVRIEQAKTLLSQTELSITEITQLVGYAETVSFQNNFKRIFQCTPGQYRIAMRGKNSERQ